MHRMIMFIPPRTCSRQAMRLTCIINFKDATGYLVKAQSVRHVREEVDVLLSPV